MRTRTAHAHAHKPSFGAGVAFLALGPPPFYGWPVGSLMTHRVCCIPHDDWLFFRFTRGRTAGCGSFSWPAGLTGLTHLFVRCVVSKVYPGELEEIVLGLLKLFPPARYEYDTVPAPIGI
jgi:hypothetical protein